MDGEGGDRALGDGDFEEDQRHSGGPARELGECSVGESDSEQHKLLSFKPEKPNTQTWLFSTMAIGFWVTYAAEQLCTSGLAVPPLFLSASGHARGRRSTAAMPCWGEGSVPHRSGSYHCFYLLSSALSLTGNPHPPRRRGRKQAVVPKGYYSSKSGCKINAFCLLGLFYMCMCWSMTESRKRSLKIFYRKAGCQAGAGGCIAPCIAPAGSFAEYCAPC